jgi:hypothetical protein
MFGIELNALKSLEYLRERFPRKFIQNYNLDTIDKSVENNILLFAEVYNKYDPNLSLIDNEVKMALYFMKISNHYSHVNISNLMRRSNNNVFEIYDFEFNQLYRSASFMMFETYDIVELMTNSNFMLYDREPVYAPSIQNKIAECVEHEKLVKFDIPKHPVWEKYGDANLNYFWEMDLGYCCPIYKRSINSDKEEMSGVFISHTTEQIFKPIHNKLQLTEDVSL